jgi:flagellar motor switch/type III secretory pathway protein FliN
VAPALRRFPWEALDRLPRAEVRAARQAREQLLPWLDPASIAAAAARLLGVPVEIQVRATRALAAPPPAPGAPGTPGTRRAAGVRVCLGLDAERPWRIAVDLETSLAVRLCTAVLGQPAGFVDPGASASPEVAGAAAALVIAAARRTGRGAAWRLAQAAPSSPCAVVSALVIIGDEVFEAIASVPLSAPSPGPPPFTRAALSALGELPLTLPVVGAAVELPRASLEALVPGAALAPGPGWLLRRGRSGALEGRAALVAGASEVGLEVEVRGGLGQGPSLVLTPRSAALPWDALAHSMPDHDAPGTPPHELPDAPQALEDAPVVLRIEVATVTLTARAWAQLSAGDVVATGVRLGEPVSLRAGGVTFARGELCDLEGELAVRILERKGHEP